MGRQWISRKFGVLESMGRTWVSHGLSVAFAWLYSAGPWGTRSPMGNSVWLLPMGRP